MTPLVDPAWLKGRLGAEHVRVVDCRHALAEPGAGHARYLEGHIAGAAHMDVDTDLAGPRGRVGGRHPLPAPDAFTAAARRAGISGTSAVVAYDENMTGGAARLWWLLRHFGHDRSGVLDGGFDGWDGPVRTGEEVIPAGDFQARPRTDDTMDAHTLVSRLGFPDHLLIDARTGARYRGDEEPIDPVAGHIPGALNLPFTSAFPVPPGLVHADGELVAYCGSGVTATVVLLALASAGRQDAKLYPGSWSDWVARGLPVATGEGPSTSVMSP